MNIMWYLYLISILDAVKTINIVLVISSILIIALSMLMGPIIASEYHCNFLDILKKYIKYIKCYLIVLCFLVLSIIFIPSENTMYTMLGVNVGENVYNSEIAKKGIKVLELKLDEILAKKGK